jgi:hypothetical protein
VLGGERVIGYLGLGVGEPTQERRFAGIGQTDQAGVGDHLQLEDDPAFFAGSPWLGFSWGAVGGRGEGPISSAALAAHCHSNFLIRRGQITEHVASITVQDQSAGRNTDNNVTAAPASAIASLTTAATLGTPMLPMDDLSQVVRARHRTNDHIAAMAAVAAVRTAARYILLPPEATTAPSTVAPFDIQGYPVDKHRSVSIFT